MQLLLLIIHDPKQMETILVRMMEAGIRGGSLVECEGVLQAIGASRGEKPPVFSSLRQYLNPDSERKNKMLLSAMSAEEIGNVAVSAAAEDFYKGLVGNGNRHTV